MSMSIVTSKKPKVYCVYNRDAIVIYIKMVDDDSDSRIYRIYKNRAGKIYMMVFSISAVCNN